MKGETQEPNKGFANTQPPACPQPTAGLRTQEKLSNLGVWGSAAPQNTNYKHSALDWRVRAGSDHRDFPLDDIDLRKYERKYERMIGIQWVSLNSLNCKMFRGKTNILQFFLSRCKKNYPPGCP